jgi:hypothetical protein
MGGGPDSVSQEDGAMGHNPLTVSQDAAFVCVTACAGCCGAEADSGRSWETAGGMRQFRAAGFSPVGISVRGCRYIIGT